MLRRSRLGLAAGLALTLAPAAPAATPDKLLPADADTIISVNVRQVLDSEIVKQYALGQIKDALQGQDAKKLLTDLGIDPLKDVDRVVVGGSGTDQADMKFLAVVRGKFDPAKLYDAAVGQTKKDADHFSLVKDGQDKMFKYQPDNGNPIYATVVDETAVVLGSEKKLVVAAVAGKGEGVSKEVATLIGKMDDKASMWMVAVVKGKLDNLKIPGGGAGGNPAVQKQIAALETISATVRVAEDINLNLALGMKDAEAAAEMGKTVAGALQQVKGLLPLLVGGQPQLKPLVKEAQSLKSAVEDAKVVLTGKLSGSAIGAMLNPAD